MTKLEELKATYDDAKAYAAEAAWDAAHDVDDACAAYQEELKKSKENN